MLHADFLFLLTDVDGLYTANPRQDPTATLLETVASVDAVRARVRTDTLGSRLGTGGMETKLLAAEIATAAGVATVVTSARRPETVRDIVAFHAPAPRPALVDGASGVSTPTMTAPTEAMLASAVEPDGARPPRPPHTLFVPAAAPLRDIKAWATHTLRPAGGVLVDSGAHSVLSRKDSGGRLLPVGVLAVRGVWAGGQAVRILVRKRKAADGLASMEGAAGADSAGDTDGEDPNWEDVEVGRGLANYNSEQIDKVKGLNR
jgi:glutamate 5-kinase